MCGRVDYTDSVFRLCGNTIGENGISSFWLYFLVSLTDRAELWSAYRGVKCVDFRQKFGIFLSGEVGQSTVAKILSVRDLGGRRITHSKILTPPLGLLKNWKKTFWGRPPRGPGPKFKGSPSTAYSRSLAGPVGCKTKSSAIAEGPRDAQCQLKSCQLPRNSAQTTCTTSPEQIKVIKLERQGNV